MYITEARKSGGRNYWNMIIPFGGRNRIRRCSYDYNYLRELQQELLWLQSNGGTYEDAKAFMLTYPVPPPLHPTPPTSIKPQEPQETIASLDEVVNPMLFIMRMKENYASNSLHPDGAPCWRLKMPWNGKQVSKRSHDLLYLLGLRDNLLELRNEGGSYEDAKQQMSSYPTPKECGHKNRLSNTTQGTSTLLKLSTIRQIYELLCELGNNEQVLSALKGYCEIFEKPLDDVLKTISSKEKLLAPLEAPSDAVICGKYVCGVKCTGIIKPLQRMSGDKDHAKCTGCGRLITSYTRLKWLRAKAEKSVAQRYERTTEE